MSTWSSSVCASQPSMNPLHTIWRREVICLWILGGGLLTGCVGPVFLEGKLSTIDKALPTQDENNKESDTTTPSTDPWEGILPESPPEDQQETTKPVTATASTDAKSAAADLADVSQEESNHTTSSSEEDNFTSQIDSVTLAEIYDELEAVRDIDANLHRQLREDLKQTDPSIWPLMLKNIRAALEYRSSHTADNGDSETSLADNVERTVDTISDELENHSVQLTVHQEELGDVPPTATNRRRNSLRDESEASPTKHHNDREEDTQVSTIESAETAITNRELLDPFGDNDLKVPPRDSDTVVARVARRDNEPLGKEPFVTETESPTPEPTQIMDGRHWRDQLEVVIEALEEQLSSQETPDQKDPEYEADLVLLHLLYLAAGKSDAAVDGINGLEEDRQMFWSNLMRALRDYLDVASNPVADRRASRALRDLRDASDSLSNLSQLQVDGLRFCSRVESYGRFSEITPYEFDPDQEVLLYVELDQFTAKRTNNGDYETKFEASYRIIDNDGKRVSDYTFPTESEVCRNRRRDYFIPFRMWFPKNLHPGEYTLQLTVEDKIGEKFGQASVDFEVHR